MANPKTTMKLWLTKEDLEFAKQRSKDENYRTISDYLCSLIVGDMQLPNEERVRPESR